ncbi:Formin-like protein 8 [Platanthera guangdongensis]|uniref:Formin-like protein n=1 Tax=Platanthera guangdongensis TaxID=2320717 RepID=A0ABR2LN52_9ASPA
MRFSANNGGSSGDVINGQSERIKALLPKEASSPSSLPFSSPLLSTVTTLPLTFKLETYMAAPTTVTAAAAAFFLLLYCVSAVSMPADYSSRRILHEPLYPIQWTPPPPPSDGTPPVPFNPDSPSPPASDAQTAGAAGIPAMTNHSLSRPTKLAIAVSASVCVAVIISISAYFLHRRRARRESESQKIIGDSRRIAAPDRPVTAADLLYLGTMEPTVPATQRLSAESNVTPYRKLRSEIEGLEQGHHPSPELQPLPPLVGPGRRRDAPPEAAAAASLSDDDTYYTPKRSVASRNGESSGSPTSRRSHHTPAAAGKDVPRSRRSSPRMQLLEKLPSDVKRATSSNLLAPPPPPPPPPPPKTEEITKLPPASIKPPSSCRINSESHEGSPSPVQAWPSSRRQLLRPLPPEDAARANVRAPTAGLINEGYTSSSSHPAGDDLQSEGKPKLKPLHWDKARASSDLEMFKSEPLQLNEDMIETLFAKNSTLPPPRQQSRRAVLLPPLKQEHTVLDPKKSQNIAILLRALNVTREEVSESLLDGNTEGLGAELFETLVKMAPTKEEELKLRNYNGDASKLGSAERFLKAVLSIPFAFRRVDVMLYRANFETEVKYLRTSFRTLEAACEDLRSSKLFLKLLEAVFKTGNRMNVGTNRNESKVFKLDTLLKLADMKGTDRKTTVLQFVVHEIIRSQELTSEALEENQQGLKVIAGLSSELVNVKKAATMDSAVLHSYLSKLELGLENIRSVLQLGDTCDQGQKFFDNTRIFLREAEKEIETVKFEEKRALQRVREVTEYFHGDVVEEEAHSLKIFMATRDFLTALDLVCKDVGRSHEMTTMRSGKSFHVSASLSRSVLEKFAPKPASNSDEDTSSP